MTDGIVLLAEISAAEEAGRLIGKSIALLVLLFGAIKCFTLMRRPTTSKVCVLALALVLIGFLVSNISTHLPPRLNGSETLSSVVRMAVSLVALLIIFGGFILAIIGLVLYRKNEEKLTQGKSQAIWALVLIIFPVVAALHGFNKAQPRSFAEIEVPLEAYSAPRSFVTSDTFTDEELNISFEKPGRPWIELNAKLHNPDATLLFRASRPNRVSTIIAERIGLDSEISGEALVDIARSNLKSYSGEFTFGEESTRELNGISYTVFQTTVENFNNMRGTILFENWVAVRQGYAYQILVNSRENDPDALSKTAEEIASRLKILDPDKVVHSLSPPVKAVKREDLGFAIDLSDDGWNEWDTVDSDYPEAQFAALKNPDMATGVVSLDLGNLDPEIDLLAAGFLSAVFDLDHPSETSRRDEIQQGDARGIAFGAKRQNSDGDFDYRFRVLKQNGRAWLLSAWTWDSDSEKLPTLEKVLDAYEIFETSADAVRPIDPARFHQGSASVLNQIGLHYYKRNAYSPSLPYYQRAFELDPGNGQIFENQIDCHLNTGKSLEGLKLLDQYQAQFSENTNLDTYRGAFLADLGRTEEARDVYIAAFERGHRHEGDLLDFVNVRVDLEEQDLAIADLKAYREKNAGASTDIERWESSLLTQLDRYDEAIAILEKLHEDSPSSFVILSELIQARLDSDRYSEALEDIETAIENGVENAEIHFLLGRAKLGLNSLVEAKRAFEKSQSLDPDNGEIQNYLDHTAAMLGKGNIALIKTEIEAIPLPSEVAGILTELESGFGDDLDPDYGVIQLKRVHGVQLEREKPQKSTLRCSLKITGASGLDDYSTLRFSFDPLSEDLFVNEITVQNPAGETVATGNIDDYYLVDQNQDGLANTEKVVHVPVPGLEIGHRLNYTVTRVDHAKHETFDFIQFALTSGYPSVGPVLYVVGDTDEIQHETNGSPKSVTFENGIAFYAEKPALFRGEINQTWPEEFNPWVWLSDRSATWQSEAADYIDRIGDVLKKEEPEIEKILNRILKNARTDEEKVFAVSDFVQNSLTYQAIEFGKRGQIPNEASLTLKNKYGDCKDHSLVMVKLLRAADIPAYLALASTDAPVKADLPSLDQFNHMLIYVPEMPGSPFLDGTTDAFASGKLAPETLLNERALILDPENYRLEKILPTPDHPNRVELSRTVTFDPEIDRKISVEEKVTMEGYPAGWFRSYFRNNRAPEFKTLLSNVLRNDGAPIIQELSLENLQDNRAPLNLTVTYELSRHLFDRGGELALQAPSVWENYFVHVHHNADRRNPFEILTDFEISSRCAVIVPKGYQISEKVLAEFEFSDDNLFNFWKVSAQSSESDPLVIESHFRRKSGTHGPEKFQAYADTGNRGLEIWMSEIPLNPAEK